MHDLDAIQGVWHAETAAGRIVIPISPTLFGSKLLYKLDENQRPKQIDLAHRRPRARPKSAAQGIYFLEGNTLRICWGYHGDRPSEFAADPENQRHLLVLTRQP